MDAKNVADFVYLVYCSYINYYVFIKLSSMVRHFHSFQQELYVWHIYLSQITVTSTTSDFLIFFFSTFYQIAVYVIARITSYLRCWYWMISTSDILNGSLFLNIFFSWHFKSFANQFSLKCKFLFSYVLHIFFLCTVGGGDAH